MTQEQIACIFCGRSVLKKKFNPDNWDNWDIEWNVLQVREMLPGPGRGRRIKGLGYGFPAVPEESKNILEMMEDPTQRPYAEAIINRLKKIYQAYHEAGLV